MPSLGYFRVMGVMAMGNLGKVIVLTILVRHTH